MLARGASGLLCLANIQTKVQCERLGAVLKMVTGIENPQEELTELLVNLIDRFDSMLTPFRQHLTDLDK